MTSILNQPAPAPAPARPATYNVADLLHDLGDIPPQRVLMNPPPGTATEADLLRKVEAEDCLCELVEGTLVEKPVGYREAILAMAIGGTLRNFVVPRRLGLVSGPDSTLRVRKGIVRLPDVAFVSFARLPGGKIPNEAIPPISPDIAIEVLSPSNTRREMARKRTEYFGGGTRLVWEFDPERRTVDVYTSADAAPRTLGQSDVLDGDDVLPGFSISLTELFARTGCCAAAGFAAGVDQSSLTGVGCMLHRGGCGR